MWAQALVWLPRSRRDLLHATSTASDRQRTTNSCASSRSSSPSPVPCFDPPIEVLHRKTEACLTGRLPTRASARRITSCTVASVVLEINRERLLKNSLRRDRQEQRSHFVCRATLEETIVQLWLHWNNDDMLLRHRRGCVEMLRLRVVFTGGSLTDDHATVA